MQQINWSRPDVVHLKRVNVWGMARTIGSITVNWSVLEVKLALRVVIDVLIRVRGALCWKKAGSMHCFSSVGDSATLSVLLERGRREEEEEEARERPRGRPTRNWRLINKSA